MEKLRDARQARTKTASHPEEGKMSYAQATASNSTQSLFRKIRYSVGVVIALHRHGPSTYARIFVDKGELLSIKITDDASYAPGDLLQITNGTDNPCIYGFHSQPVSESRHPLCAGTVKYFDRTQQVWNVKVKSIKQYLKVRPGKTPLLRDQIILFIPTFSNGSLEVKKIVEVEGGISADTLPIWTISEDLMTRLKEYFPNISLVDPSTRANANQVPLLDLVQAERDLPRSSGTIYQAPYLHLEELMVRQQSRPNTDWANDEKFQKTLNAGLSPLLYISDDDPAKIRKLRSDLRKIHEAGVVRTVQVLYPAPPMVTAISIKHTMSTQLINPKMFPVSSILLFDQPSSVTMSLGRTEKEVFRRFMVITMCSSGGADDFPINLDARPFGSLTSLNAENRKAMMAHNLLVLVEKDDKRLNTLRTRRPPGSRLSTINHPMRQQFQSLQLTFEDPGQADTYLKANRACARPFFMQSASSLHLLGSTLTVTTTKLTPCAEWEMVGLGDVYPIHQTKYNVHWTSPGSSLEAHLRSINTKYRADGRPPPFLQITTRAGITTSLAASQDDEEPNAGLLDDDAPEEGECTLVAIGFPSYAPEKDIWGVVASWLSNETHAWPPEVIPHPPNECAAVFTVDSELATKLKDKVHPTPLGPITIQKWKLEDAPLRRQPRRRDPSDESLLRLFPPSPPSLAPPRRKSRRVPSQRRL